MKIAVFGKLRAGKSAVCSYIASNYESEVIEFSKGVQDVVDIIYPEKRGIKDRETLIKVGQHLRVLDKDVWVNIVRQRIKNSNSRNILVAGVRQQNEYDMLKRLGFTFIQVVASETTRIERCESNNDNFKRETLRSVTEMVMDNFESDYVIINEKGFKDLEISIRNTMESIIDDEAREKFFRNGMEQYMNRVEEDKCK